jgi:hypothetical protein
VRGVNALKAPLVMQSHRPVDSSEAFFQLVRSFRSVQRMLLLDVRFHPNRDRVQDLLKLLPVLCFENLRAEFVQLVNMRIMNVTIGWLVTGGRSRHEADEFELVDSKRGRGKGYERSCTKGMGSAFE